MSPPELPAPTASPPLLTPQGLREATVDGARSFAVWRVVYEITAVAALLALARLVPPAEMGRAAIALVLPIAAGILAFEGFGAALVQRESISDEHLRTSTALSLASGLALTAAVALLTLSFGPGIFGRRTAELIVLMSPIFTIASIGTNSRVKLQRGLEFGTLSRAETSGFAAGSAAAVLLACCGVDGEAPVIGALLAFVVETSLIVRVAPPSSPGFSSAAARDIAAYGALASFGGLTYALRRNIDYVMLGATSPAQQVGLYYRAFQLGGEYQGKVSGVLLRVLFPVLSRASTLSERRDLRSRIVTLNSALILPLLAGLVVGAPTLVPLMFGDAWTGSIGPARALAVAGMALTLLSGADLFVMAMGRPGTALQFNVFFLAAIVVVVVTLAPHGILTVAIGVAATHVAMLLLGQWWLLKRVGGIPFRQLFVDAGPAAVCSGVLLAGTLPLYSAVRDRLPSVATLVVVGAVGAGLYIASMWLLFRPSFHFVLASLRKVARGRRAAT